METKKGDIVYVPEHDYFGIIEEVKDTEALIAYDRTFARGREVFGREWLAPHAFEIKEPSKPLGAMTEGELKIAKSLWFRQAKLNGSIDACYQVGRELGRDPASPGYCSTYGPKYLWEQGSVRIYVDDYGHYMTVHFNDKQVCSTHSTNGLFIPGPWMETVYAHLAAANDKAQAREFRSQQAKQQRLVNELSL